MADFRKRKKMNSTESERQPSPAALAEVEDNAFSILDIFRTIVLLGLLSSAISYFVTRDSYFWRVERPNWSRPEVLKIWLAGPKQLTDEDLRGFDGTDPEKPILLAINGTIYDVTAGRRHYGPGGSYHFFAGRDASRSFVTSCFDVDLVPDMRGVEQQFLPLDDPTIDSLYSGGELKKLKEQERHAALQEVDKALRHWTDFFAKNKKYVKVGQVKRENGWDTQGEPHPLCESAVRGRKPRERPAGK